MQYPKSQEPLAFSGLRFESRLSSPIIIGLQNMTFCWVFSKGAGPSRRGQACCGVEGHSSKLLLEDGTTEERRSRVYFCGLCPGLRQFALLLENGPGEVLRVRKVVWTNGPHGCQ